MSAEVTIYKHFKHLGIPASLKGYKYLFKAMEIILEEPETLSRVTKVLYPKIAQECNSTPSRVERAIRHAIERVFDCTDAAVVYEYFGNTSSESGKLTNTQFMAAVAEYIRMEAKV